MNTMKKSANGRRITFRENVIHVGAGFVAKERPHVLNALATSSRIWTVGSQ